MQNVCENLHYSCFLQNDCIRPYPRQMRQGIVIFDAAARGFGAARHS